VGEALWKVSEALWKVGEALGNVGEAGLDINFYNHLSVGQV
jgi:hypothetical protein